mgnify:CR=1 FL=1
MNRRIIIALFAALTLASCIKNDISKPVVDLFISSLDVEGVDGDIVLDRATYTATIPLAEETNIEAVQFKTITYGADVVTNINYTADESKIVVSKDLNNKVVNMSQPEYITLSYFQTYEWKIVATQTINRIWSVDGQIGFFDMSQELAKATEPEIPDIKEFSEKEILQLEKEATGIYMSGHRRSQTHSMTDSSSRTQEPCHKALPPTFQPPAVSPSTGQKSSQRISAPHRTYVLH